MKNRKIYIIIVVSILAVAAVAVLLLTQNNNSELRIQNSELQNEIQQKDDTATGTVEEEKTEAGEKETDQPEPKAEEKPLETEQPFLLQITEDDPSIAYVLVRMQNSAGLLPLPVEGEYTRTIRQISEDGSETINVLHLTPNGFRMEESNCEGQDCVKMGEVTLENREERVLWNMIICLPHQLSLELITREEALAIVGQ